MANEKRAQAETEENIDGGEFGGQKDETDERGEDGRARDACKALTFEWPFFGGGKQQGRAVAAWTVGEKLVLSRVVSHGDAATAAKRVRMRMASEVVKWTKMRG